MGKSYQPQLVQDISINSRRMLGVSDVLVTLHKGALWRIGMYSFSFFFLKHIHQNGNWTKRRLKMMGFWTVFLLSKMLGLRINLKIQGCNIESNNLRESFRNLLANSLESGWSIPNFWLVAAATHAKLVLSNPPIYPTLSQRWGDQKTNARFHAELPSPSPSNKNFSLTFLQNFN